MRQLVRRPAVDDARVAVPQHIRPSEETAVDPMDVQALFLEQLGIRLDGEMTEYLVRRFQAGGAAAVPVAYVAAAGDLPLGPVRRFVELTDVLGEGTAIPADSADPVVH